MIIWRCRTLSCDGGMIGKTWSEFFYRDRDSADRKMDQIILNYNIRNPKRLFKDTEEMIDKVAGRCNWNFGIMVTVDCVNIEC